jgi:hypothetical protein
VIPIKNVEGSLTFAVKVHPRAKQNAITGKVGDAFKLSITASPIDGKANEARVEFFANLLEVPRSSVTIASGHTSRRKMIRIAGVTSQQLRHKLNVG